VKTSRWLGLFITVPAFTRSEPGAPSTGSTVPPPAPPPELELVVELVELVVSPPPPELELVVVPEELDVAPVGEPSSSAQALVPSAAVNTKSAASAREDVRR